MKSKLLLTGLAAVVLTACGGGGGDSTPATQSPASMKISGTAAVGAALPNVTVSAKCATGSGTATTATNGTFTVSIDNAVRPCVLSVPGPDNMTLHSVVEAGTGATPVANITPLTELITALLAKGDTNAFFNGFNANSQAQLTPANVSTALANLVATLSTVINLSNVDPIKAQLVAANGTNAGNALDQLLDQLGAQLKKAQTSLAALSTAMGNNPGAAAIQTILKTASTTCAGLRTGDYVATTPVGVQTAHVDATALTLTQNDGQGGTLNVQFVPVGNEACRFSASVMGSVSDIQVSQSGVMVVRNVSNQANQRFLPTMIVPAQALTLTDLAGNWNALGFETDSGPYVPTRIKMTIGADGKATTGADCTGVDNCSSWAANELPALSAVSGGGFKLTDSTGTAYVAAFKGTDGVVTAVIATANGLIVGSTQGARALPVVGTKNSYWDLTMFNDLTVNTDTASTEIQSVDAATNSYTRKRNDGRVDTWVQNKPANGLRYRAPSNDNSSRESVSLVLGNTGVGILISLDSTLPFFDISVNRPL
ncbi:hypothetical protein [Cupriavidus pauculus]|uniref:hypothetical protein n=1 Tax=Cupriavidus pauculus TaxID=82633 RepID=UPI001EE176E8|nr:hypothetical protein [Cupriavidus pauculus]GJG94715.1 hypothetical protein CBA19C6_09520 [Cupriavidus pauculus]